MDLMRTLYDEFGQSVWLDHIDRGMLTRGGLELLVEDGLRGVTSNPTIFHKAIAGTADYDDAIGDLLQADPDVSAETLYEWLSVRDIQAAADLLAPVHRGSGGDDGFVSLEVSPHLAYEADATVAAARHLWRVVDRPNLMIKVPGTVPGLQALERLLAEGINVNVTLLFDVGRYQMVLEAWRRGVSAREEPGRVHSVASFFLSRIDTKVDALLDERGSPEALALRGRTAVASARLAYRHYRETCSGPRFAKLLEEEGGRPQRLLWASTGTKDPAYSDVYYVEELIAPDTVTTLTPDTLNAFEAHGEPRDSLAPGMEAAAEDLERLEAAGVDLAAVTAELEQEGVKKFVDSHDALLGALDEKRAELVRRRAG